MTKATPEKRPEGGITVIGVIAQLLTLVKFMSGLIYGLSTVAVMHAHSSSKDWLGGAIDTMTTSFLIMIMALIVGMVVALFKKPDMGYPG